MGVKMDGNDEENNDEKTKVEMNSKDGESNDQKVKRSGRK